jgi:predicted metal-dependent enzyme (double-stranded beta helix superfamily)
VHRPGHVTPPHDHGISWAVYGVVSGPTTFSRLMRGSDRAPGQATLRSRMDIELPPGATEVVWPGQVHAVANRGDGWGWNLVVRSRLLNEISRTTFDEATGAYQIQTPSAR